MTPWISLVVAVMLIGDIRPTVAQTGTPRSKIEPPIVPMVVDLTKRQPLPPAEEAAPGFESRPRFEPRPDLRQLGRMLDRGVFVGAPTPWLWNGVLGQFGVDPLAFDQPYAQAYDRELMGGVQLDVQPWRAEVYVDGAYAGVVENFRGYYQHLDLVAGPHMITISAPGYNPVFFEVVVSPGQTTTFRGTLTRTSGS
jgi:hypothetical protein